MYDSLFATRSLTNDPMRLGAQGDPTAIVTDLWGEHGQPSH